MNISYLDFGLKPAVFSCLTYTIAPPPIALESCSRTQTGLASLLVCTGNKFFGWGLWIFCEWHQKLCSFGSFWLMLPGLGPNR